MTMENDTKPKDSSQEPLVLALKNVAKEPPTFVVRTIQDIHDAFDYVRSQPITGAATEQAQSQKPGQG